MKPSLPFLVLSLAALGYASVGGQSPKAAGDKVNFGRDVKPILSEHCFKCHGPDVATAAAGLRFDSFEGATKVLRQGAAIVPGDPGRSRMIKRVSNPDPEMRMPPSDSGMKPLTPQQIEILRTWISQGARYEKHWSFVPPKMPAIPAVSNPKWCRNLVDQFVLAKLDQAGMKPEPEADKDTLAMRAAQTLTGLPPTPREMEAFRRDTKPGAYERLVDRLLAKPEYGEHQARYWLDAVRYGDTHGLQLDNERSVFPYRDWVVRAFNRDLPFDKFTEWQLAGDLLPKPTTEQLVATGYVRMNLTSNEGGAIAEEFLARNTFDRVDTTSTVFLGMTIGCAKCHDHKYDPIRQADYYGLYAFFNSTQDDPLDGNISLPPPVTRASTPVQEAELDSMSTKLRQLERDVDLSSAASWIEGHRQPIPATRDWQISPVYASANFDEAFDKANPGEPGQPMPVWKPLNFVPGKDSPNLIGKDNASVYVRGIVVLPQSRKVTLRVSSDDGIRMWLNGKLIHSHKIGRGLDAAADVVTADFRAGDNELIAKVVNGISVDGLNIRLADAAQERLEAALLAWRKGPGVKTESELRAAFLEAGPDSPSAIAYRKLRKQRSDLEASIPMTLIAREMPKPRPTFILKRGQYDQKGDPVERHLPPALGQLPKGGRNDRLGLARWLTSPSNPLVARVFVNRVWQQHFGTAIVKTVEDFGSQGEWPLNQPLLDALAVKFVKEGWSVKKLNRLIVTSAAFRQSSKITAAKLGKDPENRLISRGPRFRLDAEVIRDKALVAGGLLQEPAGGRGFKPYQPDGLWEAASDPASETHVYVRDKGSSIYRRSMYLYWKRTSPPPVMVTLDAPLRDSCTVRRSTTNTPLQALATLNETAFLEASRTMAARVLRMAGNDRRRLKAAFDLTLGRSPDKLEEGLLERALNRYRRLYSRDAAAAKKLLTVGDAPNPALPPAEQAAWMLVCSSLMNTNEFLTLH
ncbi:DUF1553 domain-containing protein [Fimbriimonas ginsengisoli]|uniref:Cytochrome c domain-containing protein n=1 Tax=Fimbriimonas ginsengisoli Gsoil 348 TaxID=661478 RepID=A0A068NJY3_FIMGI|nr:DUF1553 domain-containing protein [Fimbriimonas ginsengisoli]AIE83816.1 hypothetical protein OP10G_0448 [Fimbriimonas ginsengisoli Gsoil 348]